MEKLSREQLKDMGIHDLRVMARSKGVKSPTTKKHSELVEQILIMQDVEEPIVVSKKGRPPKASNFIESSYFIEDFSNTSSSTKYDYADDFGTCRLFDSFEEVCLNGKEFEFYGIIRKTQNDRMYVYNYANGIKCVIITNDFKDKYNLNVGDFIKGNAKSSNSNTGVVIEILSINLNNLNTNSFESLEYKVLTFEKEEQIYNKIINNSNVQNIVLEFEADNSLSKELKQNSQYFYSSRLDDVKRSFNTFLDFLQLASNMKNINKNFSVHIIDIDYIFTLLNTYINSKSGISDVDAGQLIKESIVHILDCKLCNLYIYEKSNYKRNSYLDSILNKYL